ncbi:hypothetical protein RB594_004612 [Gaeumannomyces avenae]
MHLSPGFAALRWALPLALPLLVAGLDHVGDAPRRYKYTITWDKGSPDGFEREMAFVNGQFPGPLIEANQGDNIEIVVTNNMPMNTTIHFHGIKQIGTPWSDGVPGLTQRYIQPGKSFTYKWKVDQYGSYWYHAHSRGQIDDGLYGPILIHPRNDTPDPFGLIAQDNSTLQAMRQAMQNVQPVLFSDWRHLTSAKSWEINVASGAETPCYNSILINGKGQENCWSRTKINQLTTRIQRVFLQRGGDNQLTDKGCLPARSDPAGGGNWRAFDLIGTFGLLTGIVSIDEHPMYVYAVDGGYIQPQLVQAISVANGDRYSVLIKADRAGDFAIRVASAAMPQLMSGMATMRVQAANSSPTRVVARDDDYGDGEDGGETGGKQKLGRQQAPPVPAPTQPAASPTSTPYINDAGAAASRNVNYFSQQAQCNYPAEPISQNVAQTFKLSMRHDGAAYKWALNDTIYPASADDVPTPILFGPPQTKDENDVTISTQNNTWIDLVFESAIFPMPPHPVHKHGTHMYLIGQGNPPKRDTFQSLVAVGQPAWIAVRYHSSDPGPWLMHCHIQAHLEGGMAMVIQDGVDAWPQVPSEYLEMS